MDIEDQYFAAYSENEEADHDRDRYLLLLLRIWYDLRGTHAGRAFSTFTLIRLCATPTILKHLYIR